MKFAIPEISWHNRDPVLSVDFQPKSSTSDLLRLATGGTDTHVLIWYIATSESGSVNLEVAADLQRHQKAVNVVRWSPSGELLASGDDESIIFIWKQKHEESVSSNIENGEEVYKETWVVHKTLRGHMEDVLDISWSPNSMSLASGSVDNKLIVWDVSRGKYTNILTDHKGFVQGVAWDPKSQLIATASSDRTFRTFDISTKKVTSRSSKAILPFPSGHPLHETRARLYHDDTLQTYYRRLHFSPDGMLIAVPAGRIEPEQAKPDVKPINAVYIYTRYSLKVPAAVLPCGEAALVARWSPRLYAPRAAGPSPAVALPHRMLLAVATKRQLLLYDSQQKTPVAIITNIHYTRLTDLTWSSDGRTLVASSTDGFCSVISFAEGELGDVLPEGGGGDTAEPMDIPEEVPDKPENSNKQQKETAKSEMIEPKSTTPKIALYMKVKTSEKSPKKKKIEVTQKTPVKLDVLVETAMPSWSDNSQTEVINPTELKPMEVIEVEDSEDMKLVYEETNLDSPSKSSAKNATASKSHEDSTKELAKASKSPSEDSTKEPVKVSKSPERKASPEQTTTPSSSNFLQQAKVTDAKSAGAAISSPKAPRRVSFVTLSSPKNKKKC